MPGTLQSRIERGYGGSEGGVLQALGQRATGSDARGSPTILALTPSWPDRSPGTRVVLFGAGLLHDIRLFRPCSPLIESVRAEQDSSGLRLATPRVLGQHSSAE